MLLKTLLNRVHPCKGFVYDVVRLNERDDESFEIEAIIRPRKNSAPICSQCDRPGRIYDTRAQRRFAFVPLWGIAFFLVYAMRRVDCKRCGVRTESVPWSDGKSPNTLAYLWFLSRWAKLLSWEETARTFRSSWHTVFSAVQLAVKWGLAHRCLDDISAIGVDEVLWHRGHKYLTVVYQIDHGIRRLLWVGKERTETCLESFFDDFGSRSQQLKFVCSDMWRPYLSVVARRAGAAIHVLDRFHVAKLLNVAIDLVRATEAKRMKQDGHEPLLKHSRWSLLKRRENLTERQEVKLRDLLRYNLQSVRAYLLKEDLAALWTYVSPAWAGKFLDRWCTRAMRSKIEPMKKVARTLRSHRGLLLNWFHARGEIALGAVEGMNNKLKVITRRAYGFRTFKATEIALYHGLGRLPEPDETHRFF
jgi:transposase